MSIRLEMLQVARLAPQVLGDSAVLVTDFLRRRQNRDGGFADRAGKSDLYYTVFALDGLIGLRAEWDAKEVVDYLQTFQGGDGLDFVHLCCLARAWSGVDTSLMPPGSAPTPATLAEWHAAILGRIEGYRTPDGGYNPLPGQKFGTAYGCFLGLGAHQDLKAAPPAPWRLVQCLKFLETADGAWANERGVKLGSTNATAAAVTLLRQLNLPCHEQVGEWLLERCHPQGGFLAMAGAPMPDLLSTATALHALSGMQVDLGNVQERCLDFVDSLWTNEGGFHGNWSDEELDCEYTFYGLLALGHLT